MLISVKKRFIFMANSKTGSTSIESALKPHAEFVRGGTPQVKHMTWMDARKTFERLFDTAGFAPETFFRFGVIREPADWVLSWYNYRRFTKTGGIPEGMSFEAFWHSNDWVKRKSQKAHFVDSDGVSRFNLIIPMEYLREALPVLFNAMHVEAGKEEIKNKSKGTLARNEIPQGLWNEINEYYRDDYLMHQEWKEKYPDVFPKVLGEFFGDKAVPLPALPSELLDELGRKEQKTPGRRGVTKETSEWVDLVRVVIPKNQKLTKESFVLKGAVLLKARTDTEGAQLVLAGGSGETIIKWRLPSPHIASRFLDNPMAPHCRFKAEGVRLNADMPTSIWLQLRNGERHKLATIG